MIEVEVGLFYADGRVESRRLARSRWLELLDDPRPATFAVGGPPAPLSTRRFEAADFAMGPRRFWCFIEASAHELLLPHIARGAKAAEAIGVLAATLDTRGSA